MFIDACQHSFGHLAHVVLPRYMAQLQRALAAPTPASAFSVPGKGAKSIAAELGRSADFSGCYVLVDEQRPMYVGISRSVLSRLRQHFMGRTHFDASLAYAIAQRQLPTKGHRSRVMERPEFQQAFQEAQRRLRSCSVAYVDIDNSLELHLFEAYAAMELQTHEWNTFRTH